MSKLSDFSSGALCLAGAAYLIICAVGQLSERAYTFPVEKHGLICVVNIELGMQAMSCHPIARGEGDE